MAKYLQFRSVSNNMVISAVDPGEKITVTFNDPSTGTPFEIKSWWLDNALQTNAGDPTNQTFTVPYPCFNWNVTVMVNIGNVPHSVSIPIRH